MAMNWGYNKGSSQPCARNSRCSTPAWPVTSKASWNPGTQGNCPRSFGGGGLFKIPCYERTALRMVVDFQERNSMSLNSSLHVLLSLSAWLAKQYRPEPWIMFYFTLNRCSCQGQWNGGFNFELLLRDIILECILVTDERWVIAPDIWRILVQ